MQAESLRDTIRVQSSHELVVRRSLLQNAVELQNERLVGQRGRLLQVVAYELTRVAGGEGGRGERHGHVLHGRCAGRLGQTIRGGVDRGGNAIQRGGQRGRLVVQVLQIAHILQVLVDEAIALVLLLSQATMRGHVLDDDLGYGQIGDVQVAEFGVAIAERVYEAVHNVGGVLDAETCALRHLGIAVQCHYRREHVAQEFRYDERLERPFVY